MALTVYYAEPRKNQLAIDDSNTNLPIEPRNFAWDVFATPRGRMLPDTSYPTGGWANPNPTFGLKKVDGVFFEQTPGYQFTYNKTTDKIQVFVASTGAEVANATNLTIATNFPASIYFKAEGRQY